MSDSSNLSIEMFPAAHGDAFLIRAFADGGSTNILVDAGLAGTYRNYIKPRLQQLARDGADLRALVVTHIDADHIDGAIEFIADNGDSSAPKIIPVRDVWHNSYRHLSLIGRAPTPEEAAKIIGQVRSVRSSPAEEISARQGSTLAARLAKHQYPWNAAFDGAPIVVGDTQKSIDLGNDLRLTLLSPTSQQLQRLARLWRKELIAMGLPQALLDAAAFESAFEEIALVESEREESEDDEVAISSSSLVRAPDASTFIEDRSTTNASSMAFLVEHRSRSVLMLGDALPSVTEGQLRKLWGGNQRTVDVLKVSHHGSRRSTSPALLRLLRAQHALVSTDGSKHGHPDLEALLWIVESQPDITIHFNYSTVASERMRHHDIQSGYKYSLQTAADRSSLIVTFPSQ